MTAYRIGPSEEFPDAWDVEEISDAAFHAASVPNIVVTSEKGLEHLFWELAGFMAHLPERKG